MGIKYQVTQPRADELAEGIASAAKRLKLTLFMLDAIGGAGDDEATQVLAAVKEVVGFLEEAALEARCFVRHESWPTVAIAPALYERILAHVRSCPPEHPLAGTEQVPLLTKIYFNAVLSDYCDCPLAWEDIESRWSQIWAADGEHDPVGHALAMAKQAAPKNSSPAAGESKPDRKSKPNVSKCTVPRRVVQARAEQL